jgi:hypothetical protein
MLSLNPLTAAKVVAKKTLTKIVVHFIEDVKQQLFSQSLSNEVMKKWGTIFKMEQLDKINTDLDTKINVLETKVQNYETKFEEKFHLKIKHSGDQISISRGGGLGVTVGSADPLIPAPAPVPVTYNARDIIKWLATDDNARDIINQILLEINNTTSVFTTLLIENDIVHILTWLSKDDNAKNIMKQIIEGKTTDEIIKDLPLQPKTDDDNFVIKNMMTEIITKYQNEPAFATTPSPAAMRGGGAMNTINNYITPILTKAMAGAAIPTVSTVSTAVDNINDKITYAREYLPNFYKSKNPKCPNLIEKTIMNGEKLFHTSKNLFKGVKVAVIEKIECVLGGVIQHLQYEELMEFAIAEIDLMLMQSIQKILKNITTEVKKIKKMNDARTKSSILGIKLSGGGGSGRKRKSFKKRKYNYKKTICHTII